MKRKKKNENIRINMKRIRFFHIRLLQLTEYIRTAFNKVSNQLLLLSREVTSNVKTTESWEALRIKSRDSSQS